MPAPSLAFSDVTPVGMLGTSLQPGEGRSLAPQGPPWCGWGKGDSVFCGVGLFSKSSVMLGSPFPGPLARSSRLWGEVGILFLFFVFPVDIPGLLAFLAPSLESIRRKENPENAPPFIPGSRGPRPSASSPVLRVSCVYMQCQCLGLRLVGRTGKSVSRPPSPEQNSSSPFAVLSCLLTVGSYVRRASWH